MTSVRVYPAGSYIDAGDAQYPPDVVSAGTPDIWRAKFVRLFMVGGTGTVGQVLGFNPNALSAGSGSATLTVPSGTAALNSLYRLVYASGATAHSYQGINTQTTAFWLGNAAGLGGFRCEIEWGVEATQTTMRCAVGLFPSASISMTSFFDTSASHLNSVFMGADSSDTNMQIMHNDGSGNCTKVDLGSSFPKTAGVLYRVVFEAASNGSTVDYTVTRLDSAASASGTLSSNLPGSTTQMNVQWAFGNFTTAANASGAVMRAMVETPF